MDRKTFIQKGLLASGILATSKTALKAIESGTEEPKSSEFKSNDAHVGFNHIPNSKSINMANTILHKADSRGNANHGWLNSYHTFSFANYYNPDRMNFGVLRVLNDDTVAAGQGFGKHPHDNMEIISIPLEGDLEHQDSMGNKTVIKNGDIQVMSAGTGITHSEYNKNSDKPVKFLQIWVFPNQKNVTPRYDQITLDIADRHNKLQQILSPNPDDNGVWIHQDAWFHLGRFDKGLTTNYNFNKSTNGLYAFVINGSFTINGTIVEKRDGMGLWDISQADIVAESDDAEILLMEIPMHI